MYRGLKILLKKHEYDYKEPMRLYCDNKSSTNSVQND